MKRKENGEEEPSSKKVKLHEENEEGEEPKHFY